VQVQVQVQVPLRQRLQVRGAGGAQGQGAPGAACSTGRQVLSVPGQWLAATLDAFVSPRLGRPVFSIPGLNIHRLPLTATTANHSPRPCRALPLVYPPL